MSDTLNMTGEGTHTHPYSVLMDSYEEVKAMRDRLSSVEGEGNNQIMKWLITIGILALVILIIYIILRLTLKFTLFI